MITDIKSAIDQAKNNSSKIDTTVMSELQGLSTPAVRHLLNNLAAQSYAYLEIGCYLGGTLRAALHGNDHLYSVAIDNFSMHPSTRQNFFDNTSMLHFNFIEGDCFEVKINKESLAICFDLYFYDGDHSFESHKKALSHFIDAMADEFIYVCDDWNMKRIPNATFEAAKELGLEVVECHNLNCAQKGLWWNGIGIIKFRKP